MVFASILVLLLPPSLLSLSKGGSNLRSESTLLEFLKLMRMKSSRLRPKFRHLFWLRGSTMNGLGGPINARSRGPPFVFELWNRLTYWCPVWVPLLSLALVIHLRPLWLFKLLLPLQLFLILCDLLLYLLRHLLHLHPSCRLRQPPWLLLLLLLLPPLLCHCLVRR